MFKPLAVAVGLGCATLSLGANAYQYGEYARETLERLITDYPGRYRGTASFADASELTQSRLDFGYQTSHQGFTWADSHSSQNAIASAFDSSGKFLVLGTHYDTYYGHPTLQGLDDNAPGATILTEIAHNLGGIALGNGLEMVGFDAEEGGLRGPRVYVESLDTSQHVNLLGMVNLDSLATGDKMYAHTGSSSVSSLALGTYRKQILRIVRELDIPLFTNPGLNAEYPAGVGCCSDGESFNGMDIPVLLIEATSWELGDLDDCGQTDNPAIPGDSTWHGPAEDSREVLTNALGQKHIEQRIRDFSRLLTRLVSELTNAGLLASAASGGALTRQMGDQLQRQRQTLTRLHDRRWLTLLGSNQPVDSFDGEAGAEDGVSPDSGFDTPGDPESRCAGVHLLGDYRYSGALTLGDSLAFQRNRDKLDHDERIEGDTWQLGLFGLYNDGDPEWLAGELNLEYTRCDNKYSVYPRAAGGSVLLGQRLSGDTSAWSWGARLEGGYDFSFGESRSGPLAGLDYMRCHIDDFREGEALCTALGYEKQGYSSLEASLGWRLRGEPALGARIRLQPYANLHWVHELADGRLEDMDLTNRGDGRARVVDMGGVDKGFDRAQLGMQLAVTEQLGVFAEANSRFAHSEGSQAGCPFRMNQQL